MNPRHIFGLLILWAIAFILGAPTMAQQGLYSSPSATPTPTASPTLGPITHIIVIVQENRSFDDLFIGSTIAGIDTSTTAQQCSFIGGA